MKLLSLVASLSAVATLALATPSGKPFRLDARDGPLCGSAGATPLCCETDALGILELTCENRE